MQENRQQDNPSPWFFVHIVESPSSEDLLDGRTEGRVLIEALNLCSIPALYNLVTNRSTLDTAFGDRLDEGIRKYQTVPVIHLSAHGGEDGIALTNGENLSWSELARLFAPINERLKNSLVVCISACYSASGWKMALSPELPFSVLIGHSGVARWDDCAIAFLAFYHRLSKGATLEECVEAMKVASGDDQFSVKYAESIHWLFRTLWEHARRIPSPIPPPPPPPPHM